MFSLEEHNDVDQSWVITVSGSELEDAMEIRTKNHRLQE